jgi:hypothetical protein
VVGASALFPHTKDLRRRGRRAALDDRSKDDGPHLAHLSVGEIVLGDDQLIRLALWLLEVRCLEPQDRDVLSKMASARSRAAS